MSSKIQKRVNLILILLFLSYVVVSIWVNQRSYPKRLKAFHDLKLEGTITYLFSSSGGTRIRLNHSDKKYVLYTKYNQSLESFFYRFAAVGDSIFKDKNDPYIQLFKNGKGYLFQTTPLE